MPVNFYKRVKIPIPFITAKNKQNAWYEIMYQSSMRMWQHDHSYKNNNASIILASIL